MQRAFFSHFEREENEKEEKKVWQRRRVNVFFNHSIWNKFCSENIFKACQNVVD